MIPLLRTTARIGLLLLAWIGLTVPAARAQRAVDADRGFIAAATGLRGLGHVRRVLVIGAHPDDEDTALLTWLERGLGGDAAYLSLTRGEGGQNLIGPELGVGLGLIRTEELLAARRLDGARQFFSRAYDFGYSKTAEETFRFWPRDSLLADVVSVVRRFRPQVVVSIFSGTSRDGHGQHQAAGIVARAAFDAAGDPRVFPDQVEAGLDPWTPLKLYRSTRFDTAATTLTIATGSYDPLYGRSYHQIAMASRSQHRSQDMGRIEGLGPHPTRLQRLESRVPAGPAEAESSLFEGVDQGLAGWIARSAPEPLRSELEVGLARYLEAVDEARSRLDPWNPSAVVPALASALRRLRAVRDLLGPHGGSAGHLGFLLDGEERKLEGVLADAAGLVLEAFADDDLLVPGGSSRVEVEIWNGGDRALELRGVELRAPDGWAVEPLDRAATTLEPGSLVRRGYRVTVPPDAEPTEPYFLRAPRNGALYRWPADYDLRGLPFQPALLGARAELEIADASIGAGSDVVYRFADPARGEVRRPLAVVPAIGVRLTPGTAIWPLSRAEPLRFRVHLRSEVPEGFRGRAVLRPPAGWRATPESIGFELPGPGSAVVREFDVSAPPGVEPGTYGLSAGAGADGDPGRGYATGYTLIDYPHIRRRILFDGARARVEAFRLEVEPGLRVGYVPGAGDALPDAVRAMGVALEALDVDAVASGDLSRFDVIVLGIRAYETNPAVIGHNGRILDYVEGGGTLIVQYQQYRFFRGDYAPYPLSATFPHDRVTDETAPVELLDPDHPVLRGPNEIRAADFDGWVQERGLYFAHEWDERYRAPLEMKDPGGEPLRGGLLIAPYGDGLYIYTGLSFFRQLPAGVPGAYRLLANLLSLGG